MGGREERMIVLQSTKESGRNEEYRKEQERGVHNIKTQIWTHWIKQFTIHNRETWYRQM